LTALFNNLLAVQANSRKSPTGMCSITLHFSFAGKNTATLPFCYANFKKSLPSFVATRAMSVERSIVRYFACVVQCNAPEISFWFTTGP
jgi:hypothetical protein